MNKQKAKDLEEAIEFGQAIEAQISVIDRIGYIFDSKELDNNTKKAVAENVNKIKQMGQKLMDKVDEKYKGIKVAEEAKVYVREEIAKLEERAQKYLK